MSLTIHDLRVSLRDKTKKIEELERNFIDLKQILNEKDAKLKENQTNLSKKDELISMKDLIIKEKDIYILKVESELANLRLEFDKLKEQSIKSLTNGKNSRNHSNSSNESLKNLTKNESYSNNLSSNQTDHKKLQIPINFKSKRIAISGESAQNRFNKTNDCRVALEEFEKSEE